jgi:[ribosomal protein S5]-alanine N-acetyltransferase
MSPATHWDATVVLRPWSPGEAARYCALRDADVFRFTTEDPDLDEAAARRRIEADLRRPDLARFAICEDDGPPLGSVTVTRCGDRVEISYWLGPEGRGRGLATRAVGLATDWAVREWGPAPVRLEIDPANTRSIAVAERCGFHPAGTRLVSSCGGPALLFDMVP